MTTNVEIINRALQVLGTRTTITALELANQSTNEAIQAQLIIEQIRRDLLRMAPWNCGLKTANLTYITSVPGTPENLTAGTQLWERGQPTPPWVYEYQYPVDCLRAQRIIPQLYTGFANDIPITTAVTGVWPTLWQGPAIPFKVALDEFLPVTAAAVQAGGAGYAVGDEITLVEQAADAVPKWAPAKLLVTAAPAGVVSTVDVVTQVLERTVPPFGGSYFQTQTNPVAQGSTTGSGAGATFNLTFGSRASQRVILTNQEFAVLQYVKDVTDIDVMDPSFQDAWINVLGARLCMVLTGDKTLANQAIQQANGFIIEARKNDGNEGLTINDKTPDWISVRGIEYADGGLGMGDQFSWGGLFPLY